MSDQLGHLATAAARPNFVFILTDDQDTYLGSDQHMPNLAKTMAVRVVEQGARGATACAGGREGGARARVGTQHINPTACSLCRGARGARCGGRQEGESRTADSRGHSAPRAVQAGVASRPVATSSDGVRMRRCGWGRQFS